MLKLHSILAVGVWALGLFALAAPASAQSCPALLNHTFARLQDESPQPLCQYQGRVLLVVNTASATAASRRKYDGSKSCMRSMPRAG